MLNKFGNFLFTVGIVFIALATHLVTDVATQKDIADKLVKLGKTAQRASPRLTLIKN